MADEKKCIHCGKNVIGRSDKKFCNDYCRNEYNNKLKPIEPKLIKDINKILMKNRNVLEKILANENTKNCHRDILLRTGFDFAYHTHSLQTQKGIYIFNYDFGFLQSDNDWCLIVKSKT